MKGQKTSSKAVQFKNFSDILQTGAGSERQ